MADATVIRLGQINGGGAADALFLKVFAGEVMTAFETASVTRDKHLVRSISSGKSATFPFTWKVASSLHTPGAEITGQTSNLNERVIAIDGLLIAPVFIASIDEAMNHFDVRSIYSVEAGRALAKAWDLNVFRMMLKAAKVVTPVVTGGNVGGKFKDTNAESTTPVTAGDAIAGLIYKANQKLDENDVPEQARYAFLRPAQYYNLVNSTKAIDRDFSDGNGSYAKGTVFNVAGVTIVKTNNVVRDTNVSGTVPSGKYDVDGTDSFGIVAHPYCVGTVKLMDMGIESAYDIRRQGYLVVAKYAIGTDYLRPECAIELSWAA